MELNAFLEIENRNATVTQNVNRVAQSVSNETLEEKIYLLRQSLQNSELQSTQVQLGSNNNKNINGHFH